MLWVKIVFCIRVRDVYVPRISWVIREDEENTVLILAVEGEQEKECDTKPQGTPHTKIQTHPKVGSYQLPISPMAPDTIHMTPPRVAGTCMCLGKGEPSLPATSRQKHIQQSRPKAKDVPIHRKDGTLLIGRVCISLVVRLVPTGECQNRHCLLWL